MALEQMMRGLIGELKLTPHLDHLYRRHVPSALRGTFFPEYRAARTIISSIDADIAELAQEKISYFSQRSLDLLDTTGRDIITFSDSGRQQRFVSKIETSIDALATIAHRGIEKAYDYVEAKLNTPIVQYFARRKLKRMNVPSYASLHEQVHDYTESARGMLGRIYPSFFTYTSRDATLRHRSSGESIDDLAEPYRASRSSYEQFKRDLSYSGSPHNSFIETCVGVIGSLVKYICSWF